MERKKILIVDDEEDFLQLVKLNLEKTTKYEVKTLVEGKDVLEEVNFFKPDVILLDLIMPSIGGLEVCEMLNNDPIGKEIPVIALSALGKQVDKAKAYSLGVEEYMVKPVSMSDIVVAIEKVLNLKNNI